MTAPAAKPAATISKPTAKPTDRKLQMREVMDWLIQDGLIAADLGQAFLAEQRSRRVDHPVLLLAEERFKSAKPPHKTLDAPFLTEWLAGRVGLPYFHIDPLKIDLRSVTEVMSSDYALRRNILPVEFKGRDAIVATSEPYQTGWVKDLAEMLRLNIRLVLANPQDIKRYIGEFYNLARSVKRAEESGGGAQALNNFEQLVELGKSGRALDANDHHIVHLVDWLWQYAFDQRASDIHVEPRRDIGIMRFRIDGVLHQVYQMPAAVLVAMTARIKILSRIDVVEKRRPQDGRIKTRMPDGQEIELRISTLPTAFGEKLVMRIFDPEVLSKDFTDLGFAKDEHDTWTRMMQEPGGILLVTGPTGSGKTTTLYTTLKQLATPEVNVCTVEDPIEMVEPKFNQMQVVHDIGLGFAEAVRALMRQDPDIIMVGEIRDLETAEMAVQAALTGHLVFSTLHTNDAPTAVSRLLDLGVASYLLNATVIGVMAQRLARTLCPHCKEKVAFQRDEDKELWQRTIAPFKAPAPDYVYRPVGCLECRNTGFLGRVGIYEIMPLDSNLKRHITDETNLQDLTREAYKSGMRPLRVAGAMKVAQGLTTLEEILKVAPTG